MSRVDKMFVVKVTVNFHHEHFIDPTSVSENEFEELGLWLHRKIINLNAESTYLLLRFCTSFSLVIPY